MHAGKFYVNLSIMLLLSQDSSCMYPKQDLLFCSDGDYGNHTYTYVKR